MSYQEIGPTYSSGTSAPSKVPPWISGVAALGAGRVVAGVTNGDETRLITVGGQPTPSPALAKRAVIVPSADGAQVWVIQGPDQPILRATGTEPLAPMPLRAPEHAVRSGLVTSDSAALLVLLDGRVVRLSGSGLTEVVLPEGTPKVWSVASAPGSGYLLVHRQNCSVTSVSESFERRWKFGGVAGHKLDQLASPEHAVAWKGRIVVADTRNDRLAVLDSHGKLVRHVAGGAVGSEDGLLSYPHSLCVDQAGRLVVGDAGNSRVLAYDADFAERRTLWGSPTVARHRFHYPRSAETGAGGRLLVADSYNQRVVCLGSAEEREWRSADGQDLWWPRHALFLDDTVTVVDSRNGRLLHVVDGVLTERPLSSVDGSAVRHGDPHFLRPLASGFVLSDTDANRVVQFDRGGRVVASWGGEPHHSASDTALPDQVAVPVADCHDGLLTDDGQIVWLVDTGNNRILMMRRDGSGRREFEPAGPLLGGTGLAYPRSISVYEGLMAIADAGNHRVLVCRVDSAEVVWSFGGAGRGLSSTTLADPRFVRLGPGPDGPCLTVVDYGNHRILRWPRLTAAHAGRGQAFQSSSAVPTR